MDTQTARTHSTHALIECSMERRIRHSGATSKKAFDRSSAKWVAFASSQIVTGGAAGKQCIGGEADSCKRVGSPARVSRRVLSLKAFPYAKAARLPKTYEQTVRCVLLVALGKQAWLGSEPVHALTRCCEQDELIQQPEKKA
eukprot:2607562-Pleurochrysis_carterae.AAC.1